MKQNRIFSRLIKGNRKDFHHFSSFQIAFFATRHFSASDHQLIGKFLDVQILEALPNSLRGALPDS